MQTKHEILLLPEVAERLRVSTATVNRLLSRRRKGVDDLFPLPLSTFKGKGRWLSGDIDDYIELLAKVNTTNVIIPNAEQRRKRKNKEQREKSVVAASERLGLKNAKPNQESK